MTDPTRESYQDLKATGELQTYPAMHAIRNRLTIENAIYKYSNLAANVVTRGKVDAILVSDKRVEDFSILGEFYWSGLFI